MLFQAGENTYNGTRWGDYSGAGIDPVDQTAIWVGRNTRPARRRPQLGHVDRRGSSSRHRDCHRNCNRHRDSDCHRDPNNDRYCHDHRNCDRHDYCDADCVGDRDRIGIADCDGVRKSNRVGNSDHHRHADRKRESDGDRDRHCDANGDRHCDCNSDCDANRHSHAAVWKVERLGQPEFWQGQGQHDQEQKPQDQNKGKGTLQVTIGTILPPFSVSSGTFDLSKGKTKTVKVQFRPTATGATPSQILDIRSDDPSHLTHNVTASGAGE